MTFVEVNKIFLSLIKYAFTGGRAGIRGIDVSFSDYKVLYSFNRAVALDQSLCTQTLLANEMAELSNNIRYERTLKPHQ